jgi:hypothetical protein
MHGLAVSIGDDGRCDLCTVRARERNVASRSWCKVCGLEIVLNADSHWDHIGVSLSHPAVPA